jgi:hypothetical protein
MTKRLNDGSSLIIYLHHQEVFIVRVIAASAHFPNKTHEMRAQIIKNSGYV